MFEILLDLYDLKDERRTGWELRRIEDPETVAGHSWGAAVLTFLYGQREEIDIDRAIKMALVHDMAEYDTGDFPIRADSQAKQIDRNRKKKMEKEVMKRLDKKIDRELVLNLWEEYENSETKEARFVKDMDMVDMCLQALKYEKDGRYDKNEENPNFMEYERLDEFFATTKDRISTETGKKLFEEIKKRYTRLREK